MVNQVLSTTSGVKRLVGHEELGCCRKICFSWSKEDAIYPTFASPMQDIYWLLICSLVLQKQIFLGNQTTLSLELVVTAIVTDLPTLPHCAGDSRIWTHLPLIRIGHQISRILTIGGCGRFSRSRHRSYKLCEDTRVSRASALSLRVYEAMTRTWRHLGVTCIAVF